MGNSTVSDARNITLVMDFYELTMSYDYFKQGKKDEIAYFDMFWHFQLLMYIGIQCQKNQMRSTSMWVH